MESGFYRTNGPRVFAAKAFKTQRVAGCGCDQNKPSKDSARRRRQDQTEVLAAISWDLNQSFWKQGYPSNLLERL